MHILDFAMQVELRGQELYKDFEKSAPNQGMKTIFRMLHDQEKKHFETFQRMKEKKDIEFSQDSFLDDVKNIFTGWKENKDKIDFSLLQADVYRKALDLEKKSIDFYKDKAKESNDANEKEIFDKIAKEEKTHFDIIENMIDFITKPERWVENAEFNKIGEEY
ncbi:MAG: ferritin family protein [Candidatus Aceula meridiana]|nr:ferritin family protein [Candidatus Aceula meridiana]